MSHKTPKVKSNKDYKDYLKKAIQKDNKNYKYYESLVKPKAVDK